MSGVIYTFVVLSSIGFIIDFLLTGNRNRAIKSWLVDFYISASEGNWRNIFSLPTRLMSRIFDGIFGKQIFSIRYIFNVIITSIVITVFIYIISFSYTFIYRSNFDKLCSPPEYRLIPHVIIYISPLISYSILINVLFDVISWPIIHFFFKKTENPKSSFMYAIISIITAVIILHLIYAMSFPMSVLSYFWNKNHIFAFKQFIDLFPIEFFKLHNFLYDVGFPYSFDCKSATYTKFSISNTNSVRISAIGPTIPLLIYMTISVFCGIVYYTKRFTQKPLVMFIERLESSPRIFTAIGIFCSSIVTVLKFFWGN